MMSQIDAYALLEHIEKLAAIETAAIVTTEQGAERRRGRMDAFAMLERHIKDLGPSDATPSTPYVSSLTAVESY